MTDLFAGVRCSPMPQRAFPLVMATAALHVPSPVLGVTQICTLTGEPARPADGTCPGRSGETTRCEPPKRWVVLPIRYTLPHRFSRHSFSLARRRHALDLHGAGNRAVASFALWQFAL